MGSDSESPRHGTPGSDLALDQCRKISSWIHHTHHMYVDTESSSFSIGRPKLRLFACCGAHSRGYASNLRHSSRKGHQASPSDPLSFLSVLDVFRKHFLDALEICDKRRDFPGVYISSRRRPCLVPPSNSQYGGLQLGHVRVVPYVLPLAQIISFSYLIGLVWLYGL